MLSWLVITFLPISEHLLISWLQSPSTVILEPQKIKSVTVSIISPSICHEMMEPDAMILVFWMLSFKPEDNKCNKINPMCLNHAETIPYSKFTKKQSSMKPVPDATNVRDRCLRNRYIVVNLLLLQNHPNLFFNVICSLEPEEAIVWWKDHHPVTPGPQDKVSRL